jgi:heat-inducible transcriptional repressor
MRAVELSDRARCILATLVREYVETGEPVASLTLATRAGLGVSSATVRNLLARLEDEGYVHQPHTSAGRVPTDRGYRVYVDRLLEARRPPRTATVVEARLRHGGVPPLMDDALLDMSHVLSRVSRHVGFALAQPVEVAILERIEFIPVARTKVLVVVVACGGQVAQKIVDLGEQMSADELRQAATYLNTEFGGLPLGEVHGAIERRLRLERTLYDALLSRALRLASSTLDDLPQRPTLFVEGASSLLVGEDEGQSHAHGDVSLGTLRALLRMMEEKRRLARLLQAYMHGPGLTVVIGHEHSAPDLRPFSLVAASYTDGERTGTVGVIGPTRMDYSRAIAVVEGVAQAISRVVRAEN